MEERTITLAKGETLDESFEITADWDSLSGCTILMHVRKSHRGRQFAVLSSANGNLGVRKTKDGFKVSLWALGSAFVNIPAAKYRFDAYAQCNERKVIIGTGYLDLLPNLVNDCDLADIGTVTDTECFCIAPPEIVSANRYDELCCCECSTYTEDMGGQKKNDVPLYYQVTHDAQLESLAFSATIGVWGIESFYEGKWVRDPSLSVNTNMRRVVYHRFAQYRENTPKWDRKFQEGGAQCNDCHDSVLCNDFYVKVKAVDVCGNESVKRFLVSVDGAYPPTTGEQFSLTPTFCNSDAGAISIN